MTRNKKPEIINLPAGKLDEIKTIVGQEIRTTKAG
jgi:hypothetical protein